MRIAIITDAWHPQVNGVVRTLSTVAGELQKIGHEPVFITPEQFRTLPCPTYPEIRLALCTTARVGRMIAGARADAIHIATEGPLGHAARGYCLAEGLAFTTSYHTRFPELIRDRLPFAVAEALAWRYLRWFHKPSTAIMIATPSAEAVLRDNGFDRLKQWSRGVDTKLFRPRRANLFDGPKPHMVYMGRLSQEKGIDDFLKLDLPGTKYVVGDGPTRAQLMRRYPDAVFTGYKTGDDLAAHLASADVFVMPSRAETFGLVMLEALAAGVPVAAYPVPGPMDVVTDKTGALDFVLQRAILRALTCQRRDCRALALNYSWAESARQFLANLHPVKAS